MFANIEIKNSLSSITESKKIHSDRLIGLIVVGRDIIGTLSCLKIRFCFPADRILNILGRLFYGTFV